MDHFACPPPRIQRVSNTGHRAATPGRMISLNPMPEPLERGSTRLIPAVKKATANNNPIPAYASAMASNSILGLATVDRNHSSANLRRLIRDQMDQELSHLIGMNPFRIVRARHRRTVGGSIHGAGKHDICGHIPAHIFARDGPY